MKITSLISHEGNILNDKFWNFVNENAGKLVEFNLSVLDKPAHCLFKYIFGYLIKDMAEHIGEPIYKTHLLMRNSFCTFEVESFDDIPQHHKNTALRYIKIDAEGNEYYIYTKRASSMNTEELRDYMRNIEEHFFDFLEGHLNEKKQREAQALRELGLKEELNPEDLLRAQKLLGED